MAILFGTFGLTVSQVHFYFLRKRERILKRAGSLTHAAELLDAHVAAFDIFVGDNDTPNQLKKLIVQFGDAISAAETAHQLACVLAEQEPSYISDDAQSIINCLDKLGELRPDLVRTFEVSVTSGFFYMFLRWPETMQPFEEAATHIAADRTQGIRFVAKAAQMQSQRPEPHIEELGPLVAMA